MRRSELKSALGRLFGHDVPAGDRARTDALERELLHAYDRTEHRATRRPSWPGLALASVGGLALLIGACRYPVEYDMELGARVGILVPLDRKDDVNMEAIVQYVEENYPVETLDVRARVEKHVAADGTETGELRMELDMAAADVDADALWEDLEQAFPELEGSRMEDELLEGTVRGTLGGKLSHDLLDIVIDTHGVEEARERVLADLEARGIDRRDATVEIEADGDRKEVKIMLRQEAHPNE